MKLWLISQFVQTGYDTFDSAVVAAETAEDASTIRPSIWGSDGLEENDSAWASQAEDVSTTLIGEAVEGTKRGVILASFNAG